MEYDLESVMKNTNVVFFLWKNTKFYVGPMCIIERRTVVNVMNYIWSWWYTPTIRIILRYFLSTYHDQSYIRVWNARVCKYMRYIHTYNIQYDAYNETRTTYFNITHKHIKEHVLRHWWITPKNGNKLDRNWYLNYL